MEGVYWWTDSPCAYGFFPNSFCDNARSKVDDCFEYREWEWAREREQVFEMCVRNSNWAYVCIWEKRQVKIAIK